MLTELNACNILPLHNFRVISIIFKSYIVKRNVDFSAAKNLLSGMPENIGCLSRLIRLDLHQNSKWNTELCWKIYWLLYYMMSHTDTEWCRNFVNPTINNGLLFISGILYGVIFLSTVYETCLDSYLKVLHFWCSSGFYYLKFSGIMHCRCYQRS